MSHCLPSPPPKPAALGFQIAASSKQTQLIIGPSLVAGSPCFNRTAVITINQPHELSGENLLARWHHGIDEKSDVQVQAYYDRTSRFSPQLGEVRNTYDVDLLYHLKLTDGQNVLIGAGARWSPDAITQNFATLDFEPHHETDIYSWFLQDDGGQTRPRRRTSVSFIKTVQLKSAWSSDERQDELLSHDRDIRELMGARDLYIAEVYDIAGSGATQKPYGRVFYTNSLLKNSFLLSLRGN